MKKIIRSESVKEALTTPGASNDFQLNQDFEFLALQGDALLRLQVLSYVKEQGIVKPGKATIILSQATSNAHLSKIFEEVQKEYKLEIIMGKAEQKQGVSSKAKAGILQALLFVTYEDGQESAYKDLLEKILKSVSLVGDPVNAVQNIMQKANKGSISNFITENRIGGTDNEPIWKLTLKYDNISVSQKGTNKKDTRKTLCEKWLKEAGVAVTV